MYPSPILALRYNILNAFEKANAGFQRRLRAAVDAGRISPEIDLDEDLCSPKAPFVRRETRDALPAIYLHVPYLELLWAFTYAWMILYEEGVQKPLMRGSFPTQVDQGSPLLARAHELLDWAQSLCVTYTPWPSHLPSPEHYLNGDERMYGEKANLVFQEAVSFVLVHEFVHAEQQHLDIRAMNPPSAIILELEKDADNGAFEALVGADKDDDEKLSKSWAIAVAMLSAYLLKPAQAIRSVGTHLPPHHRLEHMLRSLNLQGEAARGYFEYLVSIVLRHTFPDKLDAHSPSTFDTAAEAMADKLDRLDRIGPQEGEGIQ